MEEIIQKYPLLKDKNVSRETYTDFEKFILLLQKENKKINLISKETANNNIIRERHIEDSVQTVDFIDFNNNIITDIGSGGGMPGIIVSIIAKNLKNPIKIHLYEKSHHKCTFLRKVSRELKLNTEIIEKSDNNHVSIIKESHENIYKSYADHKIIIYAS